MIWRIETETCLNCLQIITEAPHVCKKIERMVEVVYPGRELDTVLMIFTDEAGQWQGDPETEEWDEI